MSEKNVTSSLDGRRVGHGRWLVAGLLGLNVILGAGLVMRNRSTLAFGQQQARGKGDFLVVAGHTGSVLTVFALDTATGKLMAIRQGSAGSTLLGTADVTQDLDRAFKNGTR